MLDPYKKSAFFFPPTKISSIQARKPRIQDHADPFFCPAGLWPASMLSEEKLEKGKTIETIMAQGERSEPIFWDDFLVK